MDDEVRVAEGAPRRTLTVAASTTWPEFPALWGRLSGEVWDCLRAGGIDRGCRNVMLYRDTATGVNVEVGVLTNQSCPLTGRVTESALPGGTTAMTVHRGPFGGVRAAHDTVGGWCAAHGRRPAGVRWEVYGPHDDDPARLWTEVYWLLA
jgi:effector-binding domain-containing protein